MEGSPLEEERSLEKVEGSANLAEALTKHVDQRTLDKHLCGMSIRPESGRSDIAPQIAAHERPPTVPSSEPTNTAAGVARVQGIDDPFRFSDRFNEERGVIQGDIVSSILFILTLDQLV